MTVRGRRERRATVPDRRLSILVFTEGTRTEPAYLRHWHRLHRDRVLVAIDPFHGPPAQLVERAVARRAAGRPGHTAAYDEYWCVFDVDEHPNLARARQLARAGRIRLAMSNPCIELWFLLHFGDCRAPVDRAQAQRAAACLLGCGKSLTRGALDQLTARYEEARRRARLLEAKHALDGSPAGANPGSDAWRLIDRIRRAGAPPSR